MSYQNRCFPSEAVSELGTDIVRLSIFNDFSSGQLPVWIPVSGLPLASLRPGSLRSSIFDDFGSGLPLASLWPDSLRSPIFHGGCRTGFLLLGCLSRVSGQTRSDRRFSMISALGGCRAGFQPPGCLSRASGQTRSDRRFSLISNLGVFRAGFQLLGCLLRVSSQTCSDRRFSMISTLGGCRAGFQPPGCLPARFVQIVDFR